MTKYLKKIFWLIFKIFLFLQLYLYHRFTVEAVQHQISTLKTAVVDDNVSAFGRSKRPVRLLPPHLLYGKKKNETANANIADTRFYGPASNCDELAKLGYTLNGYYWVDGYKDKQNINEIEMIFCRFKQPHGSKEGKEMRFGAIGLKISKSKTLFLTKSVQNIKDLRKSKRPARLLPLKYILGEEKNETENANAPIFYGPPSNCDELGTLGYTLNGYYWVKGNNQTNKNSIEIILCRFKKPHGSKDGKEERIGMASIGIDTNADEEQTYAVSEGDVRLKRPARLLPLQLLYGKEKNQTDGEEIADTRFYGPPSSCDELSKLGYTLNGYYWVNSSGQSNNSLMEVISCQFKKPKGSIELNEERIGFVSSEENKIKHEKSIIPLKRISDLSYNSPDWINIGVIDCNPVYLKNEEKGKCFGFNFWGNCDNPHINATLQWLLITSTNGTFTICHNTEKRCISVFKGTDDFVPEISGSANVSFLPYLGTIQGKLVWHMQSENHQLRPYYLSGNRCLTSKHNSELITKECGDQMEKMQIWSFLHFPENPNERKLICENYPVG